MRLNTLFSLILLTVLIFLPLQTDANETKLPDILKDWQQWLQYEQEFRQCPVLNNKSAGKRADHICYWPGVLELSVNSNSASFQHEVLLLTDNPVPLPGDNKHWPMDVMVNKQPVPVVQRKGKPFLQLTAGKYYITGKFYWQIHPQEISVPFTVGQIKLTINDRVIQSIERSDEYLWLGENRQVAAEEDKLQTKIYRKIIDQRPLRIESIVELSVSGKGREQVVANVLFPDYALMAVSSDLPALVDPQGCLRVQLRPGDWEIRVHSRALSVTNEVSLSNCNEAQQLPYETWSFESVNYLRSVNLTGGQMVDPDLAGVPEEWSDLPAIRIKSDETLSLIEQASDLSAKYRNRLKLERNLWLDFSGQYFLAKDKISGEMKKDWRLNVLDDFHLESTHIDDEARLITRLKNQNGVEIRERKLQMESVIRTDARHSLLATFWDHDFEQAHINLQLPPGYHLFAAVGADQVHNAWLDKWTLMDCFLLLIISMAISRLISYRWGVVSFIFLLVAFHENGAPIWIWFNILLSIALLQKLPEGRFKKWLKVYGHMSFLSLAIISLLFIANQLRLSLHPQLENHHSIHRAYYQSKIRSNVQPVITDRSSPETADMKIAQMASQEYDDDMVEEIVVIGTRISGVDKTVDYYDPKAIVQTGSGVPDWRWNTYKIQWNSTITPEQSMQLWIITPWISVCLRVLSVLLLLVLSWVLLRRTYDFSRVKRWSGISTLLLLMLLGGNLKPTESYADIPDKQLLKELQNRLYKRQCDIDCAEINRLKVNIEENNLQLQLFVHAIENTAIALPDLSMEWHYDDIHVDGNRTQLVLRDEEGSYWLQIKPGIHEVLLNTRMPMVSNLKLEFLQVPHFVEFNSNQWEAAGIVDNRLNTDQLELIKTHMGSQTEQGHAVAAKHIPGFVRVEREIYFYLDWVSRTTVYREAPEKNAINIAIPLLSGELVTTKDINIQDNKVQVSIPASEEYFHWESRIQRQSILNLEATGFETSREVWILNSSPLWNLQYHGIQEITSYDTEYDDENWRPVFFPKPGEKLQIRLSRPGSVAGNSLAIDSVTLTTDIAARKSSYLLLFKYRSTRGGQHAISLTDNLENLEVRVDGKVITAQKDDGDITMPIRPGRHDVKIEWQQYEKLSFLTKLPEIDLGEHSSNIDIETVVPRNRWILATGGTPMGPAVLYWGELLIFLLLAGILGKTQNTPLKTYHWLLLGLGFSLNNWLLLLMTIAWLFVMAYRNNLDPDKMEYWKFNSIQFVLGCSSVLIITSIIAAIPLMLLGQPDMHIQGYNSNAFRLFWFQDHASDVLPQTWFISAPMWIYKGLMLLWAMWFSFALIRWLPWIWACYSNNGLWQKRIIIKNKKIKNDGKK